MQLNTQLGLDCINAENTIIPSTIMLIKTQVLVFCRPKSLK